MIRAASKLSLAKTEVKNVGHNQTNANYRHVSGKGQKIIFNFRVYSFIL